MDIAIVVIECAPVLVEPVSTFTITPIISSIGAAACVGLSSILYKTLNSQEQFKSKFD